METRVSVAIRVRPELAFSTMKGFVLREEEGALDMTVNAQQNAFKYDHVFGPSVSQEAVFHTCAASICDKVIEGFNGCIFAYGQTGAGKTYTMTGPANSDAFADRGICMRTASYLFAHASRLPPSDSLSIRLSVLEIYNESLTDLLRETPPPMAIAATLPPAPKLIIVDTPTGVVVPSLYVLPLSSEEDAFSLLLEADGNRVVAEHQLNRSSSRSHVVFTFYLTRTRARLDERGRQILAPGGDPDVTQSKLHLVDLAGSERSAKTMSTGVVQKEAKYINKSLSFLEQVVLALTQSKRGHVPYRQSKLTYMLKDSLGGNCHTVMVACVWPHVNHVWETLSTLRFSARMKNIENAPVRNSLFSKEPSSQRALQQVQALKRELALRDRLSGRDGWLPELTPTQRQHTARLAGALLALPASSEAQLYAVPESELDIRSASQVSCLVGCLRAAVWEACDRDSHKVVACIEKMFASFAAAEDDRRHPGEPRQVGGEFGPTAHEPSTQADADDGPASPGGAHASPSPALQPHHAGDEDDEDGDPVLPNPLSSRVGMTFEEFSEGPGRVLHEAYEEVRNTLREERARQKSIVSLVNQQKGAIDGCLEMIRALDNQLGAFEAPSSALAGLGDKLEGAQAGGQGGSQASAAAGGEGEKQQQQQQQQQRQQQQRQSLQAQLDEAKGNYRAGYMELQLCKRQIAEAQLLKKRAMGGLVSAFDKLASATRVPLP